MKLKIDKGLSLALICLLFVMIPAPAFSWNQASHAYIAERVGARVGYASLDEMWGSVTPDLYNYVFDRALCPGWISDQTHGTYSDTFLKVWDAADTNFDIALAYGSVSHNQAWGADYVAHISGLRPGYENEGYIIVKANQLLRAPLNPADPQQRFGDALAELGMNSDEALLVAHVITEYAIDIRLGSEVDPLLGRKLSAAARNETKRFEPLLVKAFASDYAAYCFGGNLATAESVLTTVEKKHRKDMVFLGQAISQSEPVAVRLLAEQLAGILPDFLGRPLPANDIEIMEAGIFSSMSLCDDYRDEIEAAIEFVTRNLKDHGITYEDNGNRKH